MGLCQGQSFQPIFEITPAGSIFNKRPIKFHGNTGTVVDLTFFSIIPAIIPAAFSALIMKIQKSPLFILAIAIGVYVLLRKKK